MKAEVFSVYDSVAKAFLHPFHAANRGQAIRNFGDACSNPQSGFYKHKMDYMLFFLGYFDDQDAKYSLASVPERVIGAWELDDPSKVASPADRPALSLSEE